MAPPIARAMILYRASSEATRQHAGAAPGGLPNGHAMEPATNDRLLDKKDAAGALPVAEAAPIVVADLHGSDEHGLTPPETAAVDARQDQLMARESVDGRPPSHRQRVLGWRWVAVGLPVLVIGAVVWAMIRGVSVGAVIGFGIALVLLLVLATWPVWAAGLRRGEEETVARNEALAELHGGEARPQHNKPSNAAGAPAFAAERR